MHYDMSDLTFLQRYTIMTSTVTPRPIAWTVTMDEIGVPNCAPHSFFNAVGADPVLIVLGLMKTGGREKDTAAHIRARGEFTVSLVSEADAEVMNLTAAPAPRGVDELALAGIATLPGIKVAVPLIARAPVSFECRTAQLLDYPGQTLVIGEVLVAHVADAFVIDAQGPQIDTRAMKLVSRTYGRGWYERGSDQFEMQRPRYEDLLAAGQRKSPKPS